MNKTEAMIEMVKGKKIIETTKSYLHFYIFENGQFMYVNTNGQRVRADMPEHNNYKVLSVKKTMSQVAYVTKRTMGQIKAFEKDFPVALVKIPSSRATVPIRISWEEEEV